MYIILIIFSDIKYSNAECILILICNVFLQVSAEGLSEQPEALEPNSLPSDSRGSAPPT